MRLSIPVDIRAEIINNYLADVDKEFLFLGNHNRNAYEDVLSISRDDEVIKVELSRQGLYDILPEGLFHPIDRFDNIPANEYKERFAEEVEQQRVEEQNARLFFSAYDKFIFDLSSIVTQLKGTEFCGHSILSDIICDSLPNKYRANRFVNRVKEFTSRCSSIRGNISLLTLMLRKVMADEGLRLVLKSELATFEDSVPRYSCQLEQDEDSVELYLGNQYEEDVLWYEIQYWNDDFCNESFLEIVDEIRVFESFINDYFMGIETSLRFKISTYTHPVRLSDELFFNYLNYNTNI